MRRPGAIAAGACLAALLLAFSATAGAQTLAPAGFDPASIAEPEQAQRALDAVSRARREFEARARERERECYRRTLVNACLADVAADRRAAQGRFREIETRARAVIREARSASAAEREAGRLDARARRSAQAQARRDERGALGEAPADAATQQRAPGR